MQVAHQAFLFRPQAWKKLCFSQQPGACCFGQNSATWHQSADWQAEKHCTETRSATANCCSLLAGGCNYPACWTGDTRLLAAHRTRKLIVRVRGRRATWLLSPGGIAGWGAGAEWSRSVSAEVQPAMGRGNENNLADIKMYRAAGKRRRNWYSQQSGKEEMNIQPSTDEQKCQRLGWVREQEWGVTSLAGGLEEKHSRKTPGRSQGARGREEMGTTCGGSQLLFCCWKTTQGEQGWAARAWESKRGTSQVLAKPQTCRVETSLCGALRQAPAWGVIPWAKPICSSPAPSQWILLI